MMVLIRPCCFYNPLKWPEHTAISRKVVGKNLQVTIPKGNMGYDQ